MASPVGLSEIPIAVTYRSCIQLFQQLYELITKPDCTFAHQLPLSRLEEETGRFRVWAANIGAHQKGKASLEYRLREAPEVRQDVVDLLQTLYKALDDAISIVSHKKKPYDELDFSSDSDTESTLSSSEEGLSLGSEDGEPTELEECFTDVAHTINCLFRLSIAIRSPATHNKLEKCSSIDVSHYGPFDVQHAENKFPHAAPYLTERLGRANSRRRQLLIYHSEHHTKIAKHIDDKYDHDLPQSETVTAATTYVPKLVPEVQSLADEASSETGVSQTTYASNTTFVNDGMERTLKVPDPPNPDTAYNGVAFECPHCFTIVSMSSPRQWKKHVYSDLQTYICTFPDCPKSDHLFESVHEWSQHELNFHRREWYCNGCRISYASRQNFQEHLRNEKFHSPPVLDETVVDRCERISDTVPPCPFCKATYAGYRGLRDHIARHMQQTALFVINKTGAEDEVDGAADDDSGGTEEDEDLEKITQVLASIPEDVDEVDLDRKDGSTINTDDDYNYNGLNKDINDDGTSTDAQSYLDQVKHHFNDDRTSANAQSYLDQVKHHFKDEPLTYKRFIDVIEHHKRQLQDQGPAIDIQNIVQYISTLFSRYPNLINGFNVFLPPGYKIECSHRDAQVLVTTPYAIYISPRSYKGVLMPGDRNSSLSKATLNEILQHSSFDSSYDLEGNSLGQNSPTSKQQQTSQQDQGAGASHEEEVRAFDKIVTPAISGNYEDQKAKFHNQQGIPIDSDPIVNRPFRTYHLKNAVDVRGGFENVSREEKWGEIGTELGFLGGGSALSVLLEKTYKRYIEPYEKWSKAQDQQPQMESNVPGPLPDVSSESPTKSPESDNVNAVLEKSENFDSDTGGLGFSDFSIELLPNMIDIYAALDRYSPQEQSARPSPNLGQYSGSKRDERANVDNESEQFTSGTPPSESWPWQDKDMLQISDFVTLARASLLGSEDLPSPPDWLTTALRELNLSYPHDRFEGLMRLKSMDLSTHGVVPTDRALELHASGKEVRSMLVPRIRCIDCPGKLYMPGPGLGAEYFLMHLKNKRHRERVEARLADSPSEKGEQTKETKQQVLEQGSGNIFGSENVPGVERSVASEKHFVLPLHPLPYRPRPVARSPLGEDSRGEVLSQEEEQEEHRTNNEGKERLGSDLSYGQRRLLKSVKACDICRRHRIICRRDPENPWPCSNCVRFKRSRHCSPVISMPINFDRSSSDYDRQLDSDVPNETEESLKAKGDLLEHSTGTQRDEELHVIASSSTFVARKRSPRVATRTESRIVRWRLFDDRS